ncbi:MAG: outer membrane beta-barrel protein [Bacteroidales bacterium]
MGKEENIQRGGLSGKVAGFTPEPPEAVWEGISAQLRSGNSKGKLFIVLAAAAGLALAVTVGVLLFPVDPQPDIAINMVDDPAVEEDGRRPDKGSVRQDERSTETAAKKSEDEDRIAANTTGQINYDDATVVNEISGRQAGDEKTAPASGKRQLGREEPDIDFQRTEADTSVPPSGSRLEEKVKIALQEVLQQEHVIASLPVIEDSLLKLLAPAPLPAPDPDGVKRKERWQVGASISPLYNYRDVTSQDGYQRELTNSSESARLTYAGGVQVTYKQSHRLSVESGLYYTRMGINIGDYSSFKNSWFSERLDNAPGNIESVSGVLNSMGKIVSVDDAQFVNNHETAGSAADYNMLIPELMLNDNQLVEGFSQSFGYLEIPVSVKYMVIDRSVKVKLIGGISTNLMIDNSVSVHTGDSKLEIGEVQDLRSMNYSGNAGIGFVYDLLESFSLSVEPKFRYYLHSINNDMLPSTRPYTFGLYTGVNYTF